MTLSLEIAVVVGWLGICLIWAGLLAAQIRAQRSGLFLGGCAAAASDRDERESPTVCVVIPARNEGRQIARCLKSVLNQDYAALQIVVIDDRSSDDTSAIVGRIAALQPRLRLIRNEELPPGWLGKSHALWRATRTITTEWILFLDADCELAPSALRIAVGEAVRRGAGLLTLWPRNRSETFFENLIIPLCAGIIALWYGSQRVNVRERSLAFANGQFLLFRRDAYERIGGHRRVRDALIEDIPLADAELSDG